MEKVLKFDQMSEKPKTQFGDLSYFEQYYESKPYSPKSNSDQKAAESSRFQIVSI